MATAYTSTAESCPAPPFEKDIKDLEQKSNEQEQTDAKAKLASLKKIGDQVEQTENQYKKDYESLKFKEKQSAAYEAARKEQLENGVPEAERDRINEITSCYDAQVVKLKDDWLAARNGLPGLQQDLAQKQFVSNDSEETYKEALDYNANQKDLNALQTDGDKEIDAGNLRAAFFLVELNLAKQLKEPVSPNDFNADLETKAWDSFKKSDDLRSAKIKLDQTTADAQKKKKAYEDAKAKRRENILKLIADEPFPQPTEESSDSASDAGSEGSRQAV